MAVLLHPCHPHPLVFNEATSSPSDTTYYCAGCEEKVLGSSYSCGECRFYLHKECAELPYQIHRPAHPHHPLLLFLLPSQYQERYFCCSVCFKGFSGFFYHCSFSCPIFFHINCALLPRDTAGNLIDTLHFAHPHPLIPFIAPNEFYLCQGCRQPIGYEASSACFQCNTFFHKRCLELPSTMNHPCHRTHQLQLGFHAFDKDFPDCNLCEGDIMWGFFYGCVPCKFYIHPRCACPPSIIEDKSHHPHPFTLLLRPNDTFCCNACGEQGDNVSYICSTCNIQVHKECLTLRRHIKLALHPHPISHCFFICIDHNDSRTWDCRICYEKVNIEHGCYYCSRPGCDFVIHVNCSMKTWSLYKGVEVKNLEEFEKSDSLCNESTSSIVRVIKEIKVGDDAIAAEIEHVTHEHNLIFSDEIKENKYCTGCVLPILSSFYQCSLCDFFLHKTCAELPTMIQPWFEKYHYNLRTDRIFRCLACRFHYCGFSYKLQDRDRDRELCLRCASMPHAFTYHADEPHFIFFDEEYTGNCSACSKELSLELPYRSKDCTFALHWRCATFPHQVWHKCDQHSLALACHDLDDYRLRHYCDICEDGRDPQKWFYQCETCDNAMHIQCVLGKYPFIKAGCKHTFEGDSHPLTFVEKIYYYPECDKCGEPCRDLAFEFVEPGTGCEKIAHLKCLKPDFSFGENDVNDI